MCFANKKAIKQTCYLLQCDVKKTRLDTLKCIQAELKQGLLTADVEYTDMMQLWKAFWLVLYKEDKTEIQEQIAEDVAALIFETPTLKEFLEAYNLDSEGNPIGQAEEQGEEEEEQLEDDSDIKDLKKELAKMEDNEEYYEEYYEEGYEEGEEYYEEEEDFEEEEVAPAKVKVNAKKAEPEKAEEQEEFDFVDRNLEYKGFSTLFFQCGLETFAREWPTVDIHRQSKFMYMIRQTIQQAILFGLKKDEYANIIEKLDQLIFNLDLMNMLQMPQSLILHILDIWVDMIRFVSTKYENFNKDDLKNIMIPIINFTTKDITPQILAAITEDIFNEFTDLQFERTEALARFLTKELSVKELKKAKLSDYPLQNVIQALSAQKEAKNQEALLEFAANLSEYHELFNSPEYDSAIKRNPDGTIMNQTDIDNEENNYIISRDNVKLAKRRHKKEWINHVYKMDGIVHYTKDNVNVKNYEDDYLPKKYRYLEKEQRDVGNWDDIDNDGYSIREKDQEE
ncbi:Nucleolar_protein NOP52 [Hexamita inflata]|uniref:Nucleolar protein NOP52 n=1 Tax=Hexamita inflata TaxID=28002 RepID=A0AA86RJ36_9EUKA|nr:Nucleolar protein NOP52 [Hexamita inflata]